MRPVASFTIVRTEIVRADGSLAGKLPAFAESRAELVRLYRAMVLTRAFDAKAIALQRTGRLGTFASSLGQEAVVVGIGARDAAGGRAAAVVSRARRAALARRHAS